MEHKLETIVTAYETACDYFIDKTGSLPAVLWDRYLLARRNLKRYRSLALMAMNAVDNPDWRLARQK